MEGEADKSVVTGPTDSQQRGSMVPCSTYQRTRETSFELTGWPRLTQSYIFV